MAAPHDASITEQEEEENGPLTRRNSNNESKRWTEIILQWIRKQLSNGTATTAAATVVTLVTAWIAYKKYCVRKTRTIASDNRYQSATLAPLSLLLAAVEEGNLQRAMLGASRILFQTTNDTHWKRVDLPSNNEPLKQQIFATLSKHKKADVSVLTETDYNAIATGLLSALPFVYLALVYRMMRDQLGDRKSQHIINATPATSKTFSDVAGVDSAVTEVSEIVQYLRNPGRYRELGATAPRGVLLYGPPGTGKTLLAQAVAGEAGVTTFIACSASDFVELYVGRGAARVRSLFQTARAQAITQHRQRNRRTAVWKWFQQNVLHISPTSAMDDTPCCSCIIFIDELDALAKTRSTGFGSNDEREQTLNQLLTEMNGFANAADDAVTVIVIAASNRADVLDPAILRRFDRQIHVGYPDAAGRQAILRVHARNISTADGTIDWEALARDEVTGSMSGSDLRNLVNEAALLAVREGSNRNVAHQHLEHAARRIRQMKSLRTDSFWQLQFSIPNLQ